MHALLSQTLVSHVISAASTHGRERAFVLPVPLRYIPELKFTSRARAFLSRTCCGNQSMMFVPCAVVIGGEYGGDFGGGRYVETGKACYAWSF